MATLLRSQVMVAAGFELSVEQMNVSCRPSTTATGFPVSVAEFGLTGLQ